MSDLPLWLSIAIKVAFAATVVVTATTLAEKSGPLIAGLIIAMPVSVGPTYVMLAMTAAPDFVAKSALGSIAANGAVAVFGTTISPYLFFWQAAQEMEDANARNADVIDHGDLSPARIATHLRRIRTDTIIGMSFSNLIAFFIILSTGATLHVAGITTIETSAQAAEALRPIAGDLTFLLFSLGIIGTGLLAVPVLAGSAAYAVAEAAGWRGSLDLRLDKGEGRGFYGVLTAATAGGVALCFTSIDPVRALFWSAVINGVIAVPIMSVMMIIAARPQTMGEHVIGATLKWLGWGSTAVMGLTVAAMFASA